MGKWVNVSEINNTLGKAIEACKDELTPAFYSGAKCVLDKINEIAEQTEPITEDCDYCKMTHKHWYEHCDICKRKPKDEPQTEDFQDWKDQMWAEAVIESRTERSE